MNTPTPRRLPIVLLLIWASSCSIGEPSLRPLAEEAVILAFGDSLTFGTGAGRDASYPSVLERITGRRVINAGRPGEESDAGAQRLPRLLEQHLPALVILCHGGNDILRRRDRGAFRANLARMIADSRAAGADVVLLGVPDFGLFLGAAEVYAEVARATGVVLENDVIADVLAERGLKADAVHPNGAGYRRIAEALAARLRREGAL
jgi:lysophospholipase L1-like esterase